MKITLPNGVTVELTGVEEITAALPSLAGLSIPVPSPAPVTVHRPEPITPEPEKAETATASRVRPKSMYVTEIEAVVMRVVRQFPEGITSQDIADLLDRDVQQVMSALYRLSSQRPFRDSADRLLVRISGNRVRATALGAKVKLLTSQRPNYVNPGLGWV
jgi:hypothetical protein